jgi:NTP pyrophosphatase (non-canonical NTP hydrolase)
LLDVHGQKEDIFKNNYIMHNPDKHTFQEIIEITKGVLKEFEKIEQRPWGIEADTIELMKQVGDVSKRIMMLEDYYLKDRDNEPFYRTTLSDLADELSDVIASIVRISEHYGIDLEEAQLRARRNELRSLGKEPDF